MAQNEAKNSIIPLFIKAEFIKDECNVVDMCMACERVTGHGSIDGATLVNRLWRVLPFNEVTRAKLLSDGIRLFGKHLKFESRNPFLHSSGDGETQTTRLIVKNLPFSYCQSAVARNLTKEGFILRGSMQWMKGRNRKTGRLSDFRDGRRSVFIDVPKGNVNRTIQMGPFRAFISYPEMAVKCFRCLQEGHTAKDCTNQEVCNRCKKPGHRRDQCHEFTRANDIDSDSETEEVDRDSRPPRPTPRRRTPAETTEPKTLEGPPSGNPPNPSGPHAPTPRRRTPAETTEPKTLEGPPSGNPPNPSGPHVPLGSPPITYAEALKKSPVVVSRETESDFEEVDGPDMSASDPVVPESQVAGPATSAEEPNGKDESLEQGDHIIGSGYRQFEDSPITGYLKEVAFVELPDAARQHQRSSKASLVSSCPDRLIPDSEDNKTPTNRDGASPPVDHSETSSVWGDPIEKAGSEESLIVRATQQAEAEMIEGVPTEGATASGVDKNKKASSKTAGKIKRAFSFIISPPNEKNKKKAEGPESKRKTWAPKK